MAFANSISAHRTTSGSSVRGSWLSPLVIARGRIALLVILLIGLSAIIEGTAKAQTAAPATAAKSQASREQEPELEQLYVRVQDAFQRGEFSEGLELARRGLARAEAALGPDHPNTLRFVRYLGFFYSEQGRYAEVEPLFIRVLETGERLQGRDDPGTLGSVANLAFLYGYQGRYAEAEPLYIRALEAQERVLGRDHPETLQTVSNLAILYNQQGREAEAEPLIIRSLEARERVLGEEHPDTLQSVNNLAVLYLSQRRLAEAELLFVRSLAAHERAPGREHPRTLAAVSNLAAIYNSQGRYPEAEPLIVRALEARERLLGRDHPDTLRSVSGLANLYLDQNRYAEAEPLYVRTLQTSERILGREHPYTLGAVGNLARAYLSQGRYAEAEPLYLRSLQANERVVGREHPDTLRVAVHLAFVRMSTDRAASAIEPARFAVGSLRSRRGAALAGAFAEAQLGRWERQSADSFALLADAAWAVVASGGADRPSLTAESFTALQDATAGTTNRAVIQMAVRRIANDADPRLGALVRERQSLNDQWAVNNTRYVVALGSSESVVQNLRQTLLGERGRIEARIEAIDAALRRDFPQYFALVRPEALDVAATQAMLAPDEAILMVVPTQFGTHVMGISPTNIEWVRSEWTTDEVNGAVGQLVGTIRTTMAGGEVSYDRQTAHNLYQQVVRPVARILAGKRHVFIVAAGALTSIPFGILVTEAPQGANNDPEALRATHWFADAHALINIPSIQSLQFLRRFGGDPRNRANAAMTFVGFGDPVLDGQAIERGRGGTGASIAAVFSGRQTRSGGALADLGQIRLLNRLPGTAVELQSMRTALRAPAASLFLAERSTEHALRTMDLSGTRILVLATHGLVAGEVRGASEPGLIFTPPATATDEDDGFLTASEVTALRLNADWVILSACNTAAGDGSAGAPGLSGLARAFFYAGARNLLASHWLVADDVAPRLTVRTIALMQEHPNLSRAEALQRAMREVRGDPAHIAWAHPGFWAPFSLIGDGAR